MLTSKPRKKSTVPVYRIADQLYLGASGYSAEVEDPTGCVELLFSLMDGTRTTAELGRDVRQRYPDITDDEIIDAMVQFDQAGFLESAEHTPDGLLDDYEIKRWERNINFLGSYASMTVNKYELQHRIKTARIAVFGLGGLGSHIMYDLAALGAQDVRMVEFDRVELSNLNRQILYNEADVGRLKAEVAPERLRAFSPRLKMDVVQQKLSSTEDVFDVIADRDYVVCVADRPKMEIIGWVNEACVRRGVSLISGGLDTQRAVYWSMIPGVTGCVECWRQQVSQHDQVSIALIEEKRRQQIGGDNAAFVPLVSLVTGFMVSELVRMITHIALPVAAGRLMEIRFDTMEMYEAERWTRLDDCPICRQDAIALHMGEQTQLHHIVHEA